VLKIDFYDAEDTAYGGAWSYTPTVGSHVYDPSNNLRGELHFARNDPDGSHVDGSPYVVGATNYGIFSIWDGGATAVRQVGHAPPAASPPNAPTIGAATGGNAQASVAFTPSVSGGAATSFTATSTPGGFTATGMTSPLVVTGLANGTPYTFTVHATNAAGNSAESAASNSVTPALPASAPNAPTIGPATPGNAQASVAFTPAATGSAATSFTATSSPGGFTGTGSTSPVTVAGLTNGTVYTFTVHATNSVGNSPESGASNSVTPATGGGGTTIASDSFNRANATTLGTADTGGSWHEQFATDWQITSNTATFHGTSGWSCAYLTALGQADMTVQADFNYGSGVDYGLIARVTDQDNLLFLDLSVSGANLVGNIFRRVGGSFTGIGTLFTVTAPTPGMHTAKLVCAGSTITAYVDGVVQTTASDTTQSGTGAGISNNGNDPGHIETFDNFLVTHP
jgi:hypothetical protein